MTQGQLHGWRAAFFAAACLILSVFNVSASASATIFSLSVGAPPVAETDIFVVDTNAAATNITALLLANDIDPNGGTLTISSIFTNGMKGLLTLANGIVTYDPNGQFKYLKDGESFSDHFVYTVRDELGLESTAGATAIVAAGNFPPLITPVADQIVDEETELRFTIKASDADPAGLRFSLEAAPEGANIDPITGQFAWTPTESQGPSTNEIIVRVEDSGFPKKSSITLFVVRVNEINRPPRLPRGSDHSALVGSILRITNSVIDPDVPANQFSFALTNGAPAAARILKNGVLVWKPTKNDALTTNDITVVVTDNGVPPLSDSRIVRVTVSDFLQLSLGSTILRAGQIGSIPIQIESPVAVTHIQFQLNADLNRVVSFSFRDLSSVVLASSIQQPDGQHLLLAISLQPSTFPSGSMLARLEFQAAANQSSAFIPLRVLDLSGRQSSGDGIAAPLAVDGRVAVIANESLLEANLSGAGQRSLTLYGIPGAPYLIQSTVDQSTWQTFSPRTLTGISEVIDLPSNGAAIFYRVVQP